MQAVAAAGGPSRLASVGGTKMLRRTPTGLQEVRVRLKDIMHAKAPDVPVQAEDIIFVPNSRIKTALNGGQLLTALGTAAIYQGAF
jgi:polysaccharide export outer membrane protein